MNISLSISRKMLVITLFVVILLVGSGVALAQYNQDLVYVCVKNDQIKYVNSADACKSDETSIGLVTEQALISLQETNAALQQQLNDLKALVKRLHGHSAAPIEFIFKGGHGPEEGPVSNVYYKLIFCEGIVSFPYNTCESEEDGYVLTSELITKADVGKIITFTAEDSDDFGKIVDQLTDGENDTIALYVINDLGGSGSITSSERSFFFSPDFDSQNPPSSADPFINDLAGFEIDKIHISVDFLQFTYDASNKLAYVEHHSRVFFGLVDE